MYYVSVCLESGARCVYEFESYVDAVNHAFNVRVDHPSALIDID